MLRLLHERTDDKIDLGAESEFQVLVAHELVHLNRLDDAIFRNTLQISVSSGHD